MILVQIICHTHYFNFVLHTLHAAPLQNLEVLHLSSNDLDNAAILSCLDGLSSLKSLYLRANRFNASSFHGEATYICLFYFKEMTI